MKGDIARAMRTGAFHGMLCDKAVGAAAMLASVAAPTVQQRRKHES